MLHLKYFSILLVIFLISFSLFETTDKNSRSLASYDGGCMDMVYDFDIYDMQIEYDDSFVSAYHEGMEIGSVQFLIDDDELFIIEVKVNSEYRNKGIQNKLYEEILEHNEDVRKLSGNLSMTNEEVFYKGLLNKFGETLDEGIDPQSQYYECCRERFQKFSRDQQEDYFMEALEETPWFKTRIRQGFYEFCSKHSVSQFLEDDIVTAAMCRF